MEKKDPAVMWPLWRRIRFFGGTGAVCAALAIAMELLIADIPGERAFNKFTPSGEMPLWPAVRMTAMWLITSGLAIGVLLPLYRRRDGWVAISGVLCLLWLGSAIASGGGFSFPDDAVGRLQAVVAIVGITFLTGMGVREARPLALGQPDEASSELPPIT